VNRRGGKIHGRQAASTCRELGEAVDVGIVMVPQTAVEDAISDLGDAKIPYAIVLTSGFAELGEQGAINQRRLADLARARGVSILGPNSLGVINYRARAPMWTAPFTAPASAGRIAIVSHSGQVAYHLDKIAKSSGVGLSVLVATGNEADIDVADLIDHFVSDEGTDAITLYLETIRSPARFAAAAKRALAAAKPIVVLKTGTSEVAARSAQAHTGALVGDDGIFDAVCDECGIIRVHAMEEMLATADVAGRAGVLGPGGVGLMSNSGGLCSIAADVAVAEGLEVPELSAVTVQALRELLPAYATPQNPMDITGAATTDRSLFERTLQAFAAEPKFSIVVAFSDLPQSRQADPSMFSALEFMSRGLTDARVPVFVVSCVPQSLSGTAQKELDEIKLPYVAAGLNRGVAAAARAVWWSEHQRRGSEPAPLAPAVGSPHPSRNLSEREALAFLGQLGVPAVPGVLAVDAAQAVCAAGLFAGPLAIKICSADIAHKSEIGGVMLNVWGDDAVARAFEAVQARAPAGARIDGVLVSPMRSGGVELFVGITRDAQWGPTLAIGLGGIWVEVFKDVKLHRLPVTANQVRMMLLDLRSAKLLEGVRGEPRVDIDVLADAIVRIGNAALSMGQALGTVEVNPLWVCGGQVEALDALIVVNQGEGA
jgi:acyl-CoA synthetase (NDP forming)